MSSPQAAPPRRAPSPWLETLRPFSFTASTVPVLLGAALAWADGAFSPGRLLLTWVAGTLVHIGTNVSNEVFDVRSGVDTERHHGPSTAVLEGRLTDRQAHGLALAALAGALLIGAWLGYLSTWGVLLLGAVGAVSGYLYTASPVALKYIGLGPALVFVMMGPLMVAGSYMAQTGHMNWAALVQAVPVGFLVAAILHANEVRDREHDRRAGTATLAGRISERAGGLVYAWLVLLGYASLFPLVIIRWVSPLSLLALISLPLALRQVGRVAATTAVGRAEGEGMGSLADIDVASAQVHLVFGLLYVAGVVFGPL